MGTPRFLPLWFDQNDTSGQPLYAVVNGKLVQYIFDVVSGSLVSPVPVAGVSGTWQLFVGNGPPSGTTIVNSANYNDWYWDFANGNLWVCNVTGNPGTWLQIKAFTPFLYSVASNVPSNFQTVSYAPVASDRGKNITMQASTGINCTLNPATFANGDSFVVTQFGTGAITFVPGAGVTINSLDGLVTAGLAAQVSVWWNSSTSVWLSGQLTT